MLNQYNQGLIQNFEVEGTQGIWAHHILLMKVQIKGLKMISRAVRTR